MADDFDDVEMLESDEEVKDAPPSIGSPGWNDYVVSLLYPEEVNEGHPNNPGLRRLVESLLGRIVEFDNRAVNTGMDYCCVVARIVLENGDEISAIADASLKNCDPPYSNHLAGTAETRAESRLFKKALRLSLVTAEEVALGDGKQTFSFEEKSKPKVSEVENFINILAKKNDINVRNLMNEMFPEVNNISELSDDDTYAIRLKLNEYQSKEVPESLVGYDKNWNSKTEKTE